MGFADALIRPLHDPSFYRAVASRSRLSRLGGALAQLGRLALVSSVVVTSVLTLALQATWRDHVRPVLDELPTIEIRRGVADVPGGPWSRRLLRDADGRDWVVVLDTTGQRRDFDAHAYGALLLRDELRLRAPKVGAVAIPLRHFGDVKLGPRALERRVLPYLMLVPPALLILTLAWFFVSRLALALLVALLVGRRHAYGARLAVTAAALTAPTLLEGAAWWLPLPALLAVPACLAMALVYLRAGLRQLDRSDEPTAD